jgi:hypothetical protein
MGSRSTLPNRAATTTAIATTGMPRSTLQLKHLPAVSNPSAGPGLVRGGGSPLRTGGVAIKVHTAENAVGAANR